MQQSQYMARARQCLKDAEGRAMSVEERREAAIQLAACMLREARRIESEAERAAQGEIAGMIRDLRGKAFTICLTDQCFRSRNAARVADQMIFLLHKFGIPKFVSFDKRLELMAFRTFGRMGAGVMVPLAKKMLRRQTRQVILPGEQRALNRHIEKRQREGVRVNLNRLGEAILGEAEAKRRLDLYLEDLRNPKIDYISVKISTLFSQLNLLAWDHTLEILAGRYRTLLRQNKFINLDMEEYRDLHLTVALFKKVLEEPEFFQCRAGIVLQSYLPDSYLIQQELTIFAMQRVVNGGAPVKIRLVKGANLAMEKVEASLRNWPQAPYDEKVDVDANYKRMLGYALEPEHAEAAHIGVASHNLFDIAYAFLLRSEKGVEKFVEFEMLEGMAGPIQRVVQELSQGMLLYCPAATDEEFQYAMAYLVRRLDENTAPDNFLRYAFDLQPDTHEWYQQTSLFSEACHRIRNVSSAPRRVQKRALFPFSGRISTGREGADIGISEEKSAIDDHGRKEKRVEPELFSPFENEPDTDWTLFQNRKWAEEILEWQGKTDQIPVCIAGEEVLTKQVKAGFDPSTGKELYCASLADQDLVERALVCAKEEEPVAAKSSLAERAVLMAHAAEAIRQKRNDLIGAMIADGGKTIFEADIEATEAIDFLEYYYRNLKEWLAHDDIEWRPKGTVLVAPPWNFPCSIPAGCIAAALAGGNSVIFKPAPETVLVGFVLAQIFWEAGVSRRRLQFLTGEDETAGTLLIKDPRVDLVVLTGGTETARMMTRLRPGLDLIGETGGKNAMIITRLSDRDLAVRDLVQSAFGHAGQKCSACSLAILEAEVYDSLDFREALKDAAASLPAGSAWDFTTKINPLIKAPEGKLLRALTILEEGEEWLLKPVADSKNPNLWSPGIKLGVKAGSFTHQNELFGPVLGVMRADNLAHALQLANGTAYGLTSGLHSLDEREQREWMQKIEAGNGYINRGMTGAIVGRQPFGGCKASSFGFGAKAGGPNYLTEFMHARQISLPAQELEPVKAVSLLTRYIPANELDVWRVSVANYAYYYAQVFSRDNYLSRLTGQDNFLRYLPRKKSCLRINKGDELIDGLRIIAAALTCGAPLEVSSEAPLGIQEELHGISFVQETEAALIGRLGEIRRLRMISAPSAGLLAAAAEKISLKPVLANGRLELLNYLQEAAFSVDYHRYGNLGEGFDRCY